MSEKMRFMLFLFLFTPILLYAKEESKNVNDNPMAQPGKVECDKEKNSGYLRTGCILFFNGEKIDELIKMEEKYFSVAIQRIKSSEAYSCTYCDSQIKELNNSENLWHKYTESQCDAVWYNYYGGTAAPVISGDCKIRLYKQHIQDIWYFYLSPSGGYPILPEPDFK